MLRPGNADGLMESHYPMPEVLSPDPVLNLVYQSFARNVSMALSAHLRYDIAFAIETESTLSGPNTVNPVCQAVFRLQPGNLPIVFDLAPAFAKILIELLLGGQPSAPSEEETKEEITELTEIEKHLLGEVLDLIAVELTSSMARAGNFKVVAERAETEAEMLRAFAPSDQLIGIQLLAITAAGNFAVKVLQTPLAESRSVPAAGTLDSPPPNAAFVDLLGAVEVDFDARLIGPPIALRELLALEPGDVIRLRHQTTQPLAGYVNGQSQFKGQIVSTTRRRAFLLET